MSEGPADADADGVGDRVDLCPHVFTPQARDGCPRFERSISLEIEGGEFYGDVDSNAGGCADKARVTIYRVKRHRRTVVARARSFYDSYYGAYEYEVEAHPGPGRYFAALKRQLRTGVGLCPAARSPALTVRQR